MRGPSWGNCGPPSRRLIRGWSSPRWVPGSPWPDPTRRFFGSSPAWRAPSPRLRSRSGGVCGVLSRVGAGRTREIGVGLALGAGRSAIRRMLIREGLSPVLLGLVAGLGLGPIARAALQPVFLRLVPSVDLTLMLLVPALFIGAGV